MRILILLASVGAGHMRAAEAVELALRNRDPNVSIANYDVRGSRSPPISDEAAFSALIARTLRIEHLKSVDRTFRDELARNLKPVLVVGSS